MQFFHRDEIWRAHAGLAAGVLRVEDVNASAGVGRLVAGFQTIARDRLARMPEGEFPEIQAWRRTFSTMGLKPTQYRCAAESLLRRFRKEDALPALHPLVDVCNASSLAFAIPVAAFDLERIDGDLEVRFAHGSESYEGFAGEREQPDPGEVIFADAAGQAHARRWCHRQSAQSAMRSETTHALIVAEAMHATGSTGVDRWMAALSSALADAGFKVVESSRLTQEAPRFVVP